MTPAAAPGPQPAPQAGGTTLLRRYFIKPGHWDEFLALWRRVALIRQRFGFTILFALADREKNVFTWGIHHPGDLEAVHARYYADPERVAVASITDHMASWEITAVEQVGLPRPGVGGAG